MAVLIKHDSLRAALGSGTALVESTLTINYNSEQESAAEAPPVVETAARQIALSQTVIQSRLIPKETLIFNNRQMCILCGCCFRMWHLRRLISLTEAALFESTFRYPLQLHCQPSCLCACKFNLFLFQPRELRCYNKMKGGIILL